MGNEVSDHFDSSDIRVSVDGTWQRRSFTSKNGIVTVLYNQRANEANKILNSEDLSTFCQACAQYNNDNVKLSTIAKRHACAVHHTGSAEK